MFKFLEHTADMKFQSYGKTLNGAFENAGLALKETIAPGLKIRKKIEVGGKDYEALLYSFLEKFLFLLDSENFLLSKIKVKTKDNKLEAKITGDKASNYKFTNNVKAVTYNQMFVKKIKNKEKYKWVCQVVLDV